MEIIRDPLWNNVRVDPVALRLVDTPVFQRLRYVRQLGLAFLVYPGATHSRFEHALGAYHLAGTTLAMLAERGELRRLPEDEPAIVRAAALLHDVGHYPFSHALEEIGVPHHERVGRPLVTDGEVGDLLRALIGPDAPERVYALMIGAGESPLQGLISGSLDLDKIEYLKRDALMCGVPYGEIDVDRLLNALVVADDPATGRPAVALREKGLSALESLLFAKYQMYRNVYWHHAVRAATSMYKRLVDEALRAGAIDPDALVGYTDEGLLHALDERAPSPLLDALRARRLHKRALECPAAEFDESFGDWMVHDRDLTVAVEDALARELGLAPGELLLDYPAKTQMLGLDLPVLRRGGTVHRLTAAGWEGAINLPTLSEQLYRSARWLRVFVARPVAVPRDALVQTLQRPAEELRARVDAGGPLLA
ncbi:metal-dependent phosphohydrolase HD sub domain-containing protein [Gemmatirosa kalamazoonensis]|uniref:Metal-dependent phosphohydrolase HD sub domain-containing protein n=1 Tax=Gemmatirosa kalamazoonensis TaxID=861299 RepID=W0RLJ3_9BACT|nr:HD domain-containing protein [Gemmatirosa kalamazoonensis]AHG91312.1 metal-dependent phosphohydrolase HD sub domain-containing protein [Gemmatirosa kalamazoonensis]